MSFFTLAQNAERYWLCCSILHPASLFIYLFINLFWATLGLCCCKQASSRCTTIPLELRVLAVPKHVGFFPVWRLNPNPCLLHWQADSYPLYHQGSPGTSEKGASLFTNQISFQTRPLTRVVMMHLVPSLSLVLYVDEGSLSAPYEFQPAGSCGRQSLGFAHGCPCDLFRFRFHSRLVLQLPAWTPCADIMGKSRSVVSDSLRPHGLQPTRLFLHGIFEART